MLVTETRFDTLTTPLVQGSSGMNRHDSQTAGPRRGQSDAQFELAFEQEVELDRRRREQLRQRTANRSKARRMARTESHGRVRFGILAICLTVTVITVVFVMFEALAWLIGP